MEMRSSKAQVLELARCHFCHIPICQSKSLCQPKFKEWENRLYFQMAGAAKYCGHAFHSDKQLIFTSPHKWVLLSCLETGEHLPAPTASQDGGKKHFRHWSLGAQEPEPLDDTQTPEILSQMHAKIINAIADYQSLYRHSSSNCCLCIHAQVQKSDIICSWVCNFLGDILASPGMHIISPRQVTVE